MALLETPAKNDRARPDFDESTPILAEITAALTVEDHTEYEIKCDRSSITWTVNRRYTDFRNLNVAMTAEAGIDFEFPGKKIKGNLDRDFIAARQAALQRFLTSLTTHPYLQHSLILKKFLDPDRYSFNIEDVAIQHVSMALRSHPPIEMVKPIPGVGWRPKKHFFQVRNKQDPKTELWLSWADFGPDSILESKTMTSLQKSLSQMQHPYLYTTYLISLLDQGGVSVRRFFLSGSVRDMIGDAKPRMTLAKKICKAKARRCLDINLLRSVGWQILSALKFLHDKNLAHGNLHSGNVFLHGGQTALISDYEGYIFGLSSLLRPLIVQLKGPSSSAEAVDVYSFGHLLYEMSTGGRLNNPTCENAIPNAFPEILRNLLESLLSIEATKSSSYPTISDLISHPFFANAIGNMPKDGATKPYLKFSSSTKEALAQFKNAYENRLQEDHKKYKLLEKEKRRKDALTSGEGRRKRQEINRQKSSNLTDEVVIPTTNVPTTPTTPTAPPPPTAAPPPPPPPPAGGAPPPPPPPPPSAAPPPPPPGPPAPPAPPPSGSGSGGAARTALLGSITAFNKGGLKKTETVDKSKPRI